MILSKQTWKKKYKCLEIYEQVLKFIGSQRHVNYQKKNLLYSGLIKIKNIEGTGYEGQNKYILLVGV